MEPKLTRLMKENRKELERKGINFEEEIPENIEHETIT